MRCKSAAFACTLIGMGLCKMKARFGAGWRPFLSGKAHRFKIPDFGERLSNMPLRLPDLGALSLSGNQTLGKTLISQTGMALQKGPVEPGAWIGFASRRYMFMPSQMPDRVTLRQCRQQSS